MSKLKAAITKVVESKRAVQVIKDGNLRIVVMNSSDNRQNMTFMKHMHEALDEIESESDPRGKVMITVPTHAKIFSNGLDILNLNTKDEVREVVESINKYCTRLISSKIPTIACVKGHAFAGGWFLAVAHHLRIMSKDKGWICLNEIDLGVPIPAPLNTMGIEKIGRHNYWEAACLGSRFTAEEALNKGICHHVFTNDQILDKTEELAESISKRNLDPLAFQLMGKDLYSKSLEALKKGKSEDISLERIAAFKG